MFIDKCKILPKTWGGFRLIAKVYRHEPDPWTVRIPSSPKRVQLPNLGSASRRFASAISCFLFINTLILNRSGSCFVSGNYLSQRLARCTAFVFSLPPSNSLYTHISLSASNSLCFQSISAGAERSSMEKRTSATLSRRLRHLWLASALMDACDIDGALCSAKRWRNWCI